MKKMILYFILISFITCSGQTVKDIDGNIYHTVKIGTQVWMVENLKITHYNDGTVIAEIKGNRQWEETKEGAYCWYENNSSFKDKYGALYNYYAVNCSSRLCPKGWHIPTVKEWQTLENYLGGSQTAGGKMKDNDSGLWGNIPKGSGNKSGFSALPGGGRGKKGYFGEIGNYSTWWSSTSSDKDFAWHWGLNPDQNTTRSNPGHKASGFSVRCIKD